MKLVLAVFLVVFSYMFFMMRTTDIVLGQAYGINAVYRNVANNADDIAAGKTDNTFSN